MGKVCQERSCANKPTKRETYFRLKKLIGYHRVAAFIQIMSGLVHITLWRISPARVLIDKDIYRWLSDDPRQAQQSHFPVWRGLTFLLWQYPEFRSVMYYRIEHCEHFASRVLLILARCIYRPMPLLYFHTTTIGPGLFVQHGFASIIAAKSIGHHCWINQQVTIGWDDGNGQPTIGNNVRVAAGAIVFGDISIGDNVVIGANALVCKSVPANCTVAGVPAYIIKRDGKSVREKL
jgi:serine O-acetyltransferase